MSGYRDDDDRGRGYCPVCGREIEVNVSLFGYCEEHGTQPADFDREVRNDEEENDG